VAIEPIISFLLKTRPGKDFTDNLGLSRLYEAVAEQLGKANKEQEHKKDGWPLLRCVPLQFDRALTNSQSYGNRFSSEIYY
jgi:hypothetical protein